MVVPYIQESFHMSNTDIGAMASFFYITYAVVQIRRATCTANRRAQAVFPVDCADVAGDVYHGLCQLGPSFEICPGLAGLF